MEGAAEALVIDASVAVKWHLAREQYTDEARLLLHRFAEGQIALTAPSQILYEVPSAITAATLGRNPRLTQDEGRAAIEEFLSLELEIVDSDDVITSAYSLVHQHGCSFYDSLYLALAEERRVSVITADRRFYSQARHLPYVIWIGHYRPMQAQP